MSSDQSGERKGAYAVCSPRTAAKAAEIYDDGANGGNQALSSGICPNRQSLACSKGDRENI